MKQLVILAGGKGTRLRECLDGLPKPMIPIGGKPLLEHQIMLARQHEFNEIIILVHYGAEIVKKHFGDGRKFGVNIRYYVESSPLGTAGAVLAIKQELASRFLVMYGDTMLNVDLDRIWNVHVKSCVSGTLLVHPNNHPLDSDLVDVNSADLVTRFQRRPHDRSADFRNLVNAGLYVLERGALDTFESNATVQDFGSDILPEMLTRGLRLLAYNSPEYIKDIGTPDRYRAVCTQYSDGLINRSSLESSQPAVFLDRDGTLIKEVYGNGLVSVEQVELLSGVVEALRKLNYAGLRVILVTNQPVIAKGFCSEEELFNIHKRVETLLGREGVYLDRIYYCPHHPQGGFEGERPELKIECDCRKPQIGMLKRAASELNLSLRRSWIIGDMTSDIETAKNAGMRSILVKTGWGGRDAKFPTAPDIVCENLYDAANRVLDEIQKSNQEVPL